MRSLVFAGTVLLGAFLSAGSPAGEIGETAAGWKYLQGTDGKLHSMTDLKEARLIVVAFLCNKCPCVKGYEGRFTRFQQEYGPKGVQFVGINSTSGPLETMANMQQRVVSGNLNYLYLRDANQQVGKAFGATSTPHVFILDESRKIVYSGAFDDNRSESQVTSHYVLDAVKALLEGKEVPVAQTKQFGCAIEYR
ncbi:MAG: thioredoxin family protein [Planctomycetaceae bacterium]